MYEKPSYEPAPQSNYNAGQPGKPKHSVYIGVIIALTVLSMVLAMLLLAAQPGSVQAEHEDENKQPMIVVATQDNSDSIELVELRDSLRSSVAGAASGLFAEVSLEKMNVLYIGVDNPIFISVQGFAANELIVSLSGGTLTANGKPGSYVAHVSSGTKATLNVSAKVNGVSKSLKSYDYRIKRIPDPVAYVGNVKGNGQMTKAEVQSQSGVFAGMENFDFDASFTVVSFSMSMNVNGVYVQKKATGPAITPEMKSMLAAAKTGDYVIFKDVTVKGPDGTLRKLAGVIIEVK